jgi:hypothetical protein
MKDCHRGLTTISCVFRRSLKAIMSLEVRHCLSNIVSLGCELQSIGVVLKGCIAMLLLLIQTTLGATLLGMQRVFICGDVRQSTLLRCPIDSLPSVDCVIMCQ